MTERAEHGASVAAMVGTIMTGRSFVALQLLRYLKDFTATDTDYRFAPAGA